MAKGEELIKSTVEAQMKPLEKRLKIAQGFFYSLLKEESDWSFVIKNHSLVEAAVSHYLTVKIGKDELESVFQRVPLSTESGGKIDFLKALDLLKKFRGFIVFLSKMRNAYVHEVSNVGLRFEEYFASNKERFKNLVTEIRRVFPDELPQIVAHTLVDKKPRFAIWLLTMFLLVEVYEDIKPREAIRKEALEKSLRERKR